MSAGLRAVVAIVDLALGFSQKKANRAVRIAGAAVGIVCMCIVTMAYTTSYGNAAWIAMPTWALFVLGDLAAGLVLWMMFADAPSKSLALVEAVVAVLFAVVLAWQASSFAGLAAAGVAPIGCGAVLAAVAAVMAFLIQAGKSNVKVATTAVTFIAIAAVVVSRYGFYMASII